MNKAVFLDKDGTLIIDIPYNADPDKITLCNDCIKGLKRLQEKKYLLILITNQAGVAHGYFKEDALLLVEEKIRMMLNNYGIMLSGFYYCPHHPQGKIEPYAIDCDCRKPKPGLLLKAATELDIDLSASWMIGDILNDIEAGNSAGCKSILIDNGNETEWMMNEIRRPIAKVRNIDEAAEYIISIKKDERLVGM
ncbi:MAG: hydrolase, HAD-superfamily, subfamily [Mucilaginibacter sp.]|jgi:D-glycero-D-manno-heptose 1,7-bisphosphate phosphatase|nr:hydrolase, HAD-superfamily, subfamily [Mucilaginibacter sp.]